MSEDLPGRLIEIDGLSTHVVTEGSGPPVMLLAALGSNWFDLDQLADALSSSFTVIRFDRPGYGASEALSRDTWPTLDGEVRRISGVLDALAIDEPVVIAAHSMSSMYAEAFAREHPDRTAGVLMIDGTFVMFPWRVLPTALRVRNCHRAVAVAELLRLPQLLGAAAHDSVYPTPPTGYTAAQRFWICQVFGRADMLRATLVENAAFPTISLDLIALRERDDRTVRAAVTVLAALPAAGLWLRWWRWRHRRYAQILGGVYEEISPANHLVVAQHPADTAFYVERLARRAGHTPPVGP
ncbi:alpha/beta fold hydrolase [Williamsia sp. MIQD14]|uniref:alpha/beta fold hydrolase n=1 Tax=Williamsia sp. MIQD14 TaxID=3425703 RepID=UPI003DA10B87